ncbi:DUF262 domain-containing protein [Butyrivibrio sp. AD3002]|uniref:DUF262 domain-containing protein n=1 Tax=Butyrivibrio sp. AD3002 TaxID=1280670 RepID=UPI0003B723C1|nr:DUF262 domain-containing protein [Butyrivibrio sp. AD3002]
MVPQESKLLSLLSNNDVTFFIPPYQRNYEWTDEQCKVFLADVMKTYESNSRGITAEHFFGSITFFQTESTFGQPDKLVLIDGQQRITTTMLFLVALRDILDNNDMSNYVDSKYLKNNNVAGDSEYKIKLKQVETDWVAYKKIILEEEMTTREKNSAVYRNYQYFKNILKKYKEDGVNLSDIIDRGLNKFSVITIELQPDKNAWENPQEIFESMNSLGKPLSLADLVRNYLLLGLDADTQSMLYSKYWLNIENRIPGLVSNFIRDFMQAHEKRAYHKASENNYKELYSIFKSIFSKQDTRELLLELSECAEIYSYIVPGGETGNKVIDAELHDIIRLNVTTAYSFFMVLLRYWKKELLNEQDTADILYVFKIYCLRRRILGITQAENKNFPALVNYIPELVEAPDKKQKMFEIVANQESTLRLPNDVELSRYIETMNFYNFKYCKFILALIEEKITKNRPNLEDDNLQIEHIMPQKLNDAWIAELGEKYETIHQEYVHNIGNLTLIRHNQELGQKLFKDKKKIYEENAGLQIAKTKITNHEKWNEKSIQNRGKWLIKYLLDEVLPIPDSMRKVNNFKTKVGGGLSFQELQLIGLDIEFFDDPSIRAHVVNDKEVEFEGKKWRLSPLTAEIQSRRGKLNPSGIYSGPQYWSFDGIRLTDII